MTVNIRNNSHDAMILETLPPLCSMEKFKDVTFHCKDGRVVQAHRLLLATVSPMLQMIFVDQPPYVSIDISLPDFKSQDVDNVLLFLYEGCIRLCPDEMCEFRKLQNLLGIRVAYSVANGDEDIEFETQNQIQEDDTISRINSILGAMSRTPPVNERQKQGPLLVPLDKFEATVRVVERLRAEKRLESLVETSVRSNFSRMLKVMKEAKKVRREARKLSAKAPSIRQVPGKATAISNAATTEVSPSKVEVSTPGKANNGVSTISPGKLSLTCDTIEASSRKVQAYMPERSDKVLATFESPTETRATSYAGPIEVQDSAPERQAKVLSIIQSPEKSIPTPSTNVAEGSSTEVQVAVPASAVNLPAPSTETAVATSAANSNQVGAQTEGAKLCRYLITNATVLNVKPTTSTIQATSEDTKDQPYQFVAVGPKVYQQVPLLTPSAANLKISLYKPSSAPENSKFPNFKFAKEPSLASNMKERLPGTSLGTKLIDFPQDTLSPRNRKRPLETRTYPGQSQSLSKLPRFSPNKKGDTNSGSS